MNTLRNRKGQGATEYIVILAIAIGIVMTIFWNPIREALKGRVSKIQTGIQTAGD